MSTQVSAPVTMNGNGKRPSDTPGFWRWILGIVGTFLTAVVFTLVTIFVKNGWPQYITLVALAICFLSLGIWTSKQYDEWRWEKRRKEIEDKADKTGAAWELAKEKLENYFDRNLDQVRMVFYVAVCVMLVGFAFVLWGIRLSLLQPQHVAIAIIASASGIVTQFIGLTFMVIYRSTMAQSHSICVRTRTHQYSRNGYPDSRFDVR